MLTNSCVKLQTVHHIPLTVNKEGKEMSLFGYYTREAFVVRKSVITMYVAFRLLCTLDLNFVPYIYYSEIFIRIMLNHQYTEYERK